MNLQDNIARMELELADMKKQLQSKQIELQGGGWYMQYNGTVNSTRMRSDCTDNGLERATKELAIKMRDRIVTSSQIEARAIELDTDWVVDWSDRLQLKFFIYIQNKSGKYGKDYHTSIRNIGLAYMSETTARKIVDELNEGRFILGYQE